MRATVQGEQVLREALIMASAASQGQASVGMMMFEHGCGVWNENHALS